MDSKKHSTIKEIFLEAIEIDRDSITSFLNARCADTLIKDEVTDLLNTYHANKQNTQLFSDDAAQNLLHNPLFFPNDRYSLIKKIGHGGMGDVYLAQRKFENIEQQVAIKIMQINDDLSHQRFARETKILSQLSHPHISQFIDADFLQDGRPYVVMEYIQGESITQYSKNLNIEKRISLFLDLCDAVQHAHKNLIIHQDIKPDNILVTQQGKLKLLDFGISRIFDDSKQNTLTLVRALTPNYASPEQLMDLPISIVSDVYALGIVFYEILTGTLPYEHEGCTPLEIEKKISLKPVTKPSTKVLDQLNKKNTVNNRYKCFSLSARSLKGDLDSITLKTLQFDPSERYQSVTELVEDLHNFQNNRPVTARKKRILYQIKKFIIRKKLTMAALVILVSLISLYIYTITSKNTEIKAQFNTISKQRDDLLMEQKRSENIADAFIAEHYADYENNGQKNTVINHTVNIGNGNLFHKIDLDLMGSPIEFSLYYNSKSAFQTRGGLPVNNIGKGWKHSYSRKLLVGNNATTRAFAYRPDGTDLYFERIEGKWFNKKNTTHQLFEDNNQWLFINENNDTEIYDLWGKLIEIKTKENHLKIDYKSFYKSHKNLDYFTKIIKVSNNDGKYFNFNYLSESNFHIQSITDEQGRSWKFEYDMFYNLSAIINPDGTGKKFYYEESILPFAMTAVSDTLYDGFDIKYINYDYDGRSRIRRVQYKSNMCENEILDIDYCCGVRTVTNSKGQANKYTVKSKDGKWELTKSEEIFGYPQCTPNLKIQWREQLLKIGDNIIN